MAGFVTAMTAAITPDTLWGELTPFAALIGTAVLFGLSVYFVRKIIRGLGHGKASL